tara:strand:+ start:183 stop:857 length:675 start_codon:yes stop_codon:yes gene_type:complete
MGLFSADIEGGIPDRTMARIPLGDTAAKTLGHKGPGFSAVDNLAKRRAGGLSIADAFKAGIPAAGKRLEKATIARGMDDFDRAAVLAGKKAKFDKSRSGMYSSTPMADEMRLRARADAKGRAGITKSGIKAGRDLTSAMGSDYITMRGRAEEGKLTRSPAYAFGLPTMPAEGKSIISKAPKTYTTTKKKKVEKKKVYEETPGGTGGGGASDGEGEGFGEGSIAG